MYCRTCFLLLVIILSIWTQPGLGFTSVRPYTLRVALTTPRAVSSIDYYVLCMNEEPIDETSIREQQTEYLASTRDPFSSIRIAAWALLGIGGIAGIITSVTNPQGFGLSLTNIFVNIIVTVVMAGALFFEFKLGNQSKEIVKEEMANPFLKGGTGGFFVGEKQQKPNTRDEIRESVLSEQDE